MLICKTIDVQVFNNKDPIDVHVTELGKGGMQKLILEGDKLSISNGNTVQLPLPDTAQITADMLAMQTAINALNELPHLTAQEVQSMIDSAPGADLTDVNKQIDSLNNSVIMMRPNTWSESQINNMIINQIVTALMPIRTDIRNLQTSISKVDDMEMQFEEFKDEFPTFPAMNNAIANKTANLLTAEQAQSLIDTAINAIINGEGVRY